MSKPSISIIIPAYNAQEYIRECLESVLAQTFTDFEAIVVNDGSTDSTLDIANEFANVDSRIKVVSTLNQGLSQARNTGINKANGEWLTFLDSDDILPLNGLQVLYNLVTDSQVSIAIGSFSRNTKFVPNIRTEAYHAIYPSEYIIEQILYQKHISHLNPSACGKLFHKAIFQDTLFTPRIWYEDLDFFYRAFSKVCSIAVTSEIAYIYREHSQSFLHTFSIGRLDVLNVTKRLETFIQTELPTLLPAAHDRRLSANFNMFALLSRHTSSNRSLEHKQSCWELIKSYRMECLLNPQTRIKNKLGALLSLCGKRVFSLVSRFVYS